MTKVPKIKSTYAIVDVMKGNPMTESVFTADYRPEIYEPFRKVMRKRYGFCGPYRLGIAIGEARANLPCPYAKAGAARSFWQGVAVGQERPVEDGGW